MDDRYAPAVRGWAPIGVNLCHPRTATYGFAARPHSCRANIVGEPDNLATPHDGDRALGPARTVRHPWADIWI
jgi:hypothetical protein